MQITIFYQTHDLIHYFKNNDLICGIYYNYNNAYAELPDIVLVGKTLNVKSEVGGLTQSG
jgi:hypothetical protein